MDILKFYRNLFSLNKSTFHEDIGEKHGRGQLLEQSRMIYLAFVHLRFFCNSQMAWQTAATCPAAWEAKQKGSKGSDVQQPTGFLLENSRSSPSWSWLFGMLLLPFAYAERWKGEISRSRQFIGHELERISRTVCVIHSTDFELTAMPSTSLQNETGLTSRNSSSCLREGDKASLKPMCLHGRAKSVMHSNL